MAKLYKKEEESLLNKKKKREEIKQKNKSEKTKINKNLNGIKQYNNNYMGIYMNQIPPINNQPQGYLDGYQNIYYYNNINSSYPFPTQMLGYNAYFQSYYMETPKNLEEHINMIYQRGIVNNIIGAFYIKEYQEKLKNNEKRQVPVSMVEFEDEQDNNKIDNNEEKIIKNEKSEDINGESINEEKNKENEKNGEDVKNINENNNEENKEKNELRKPEFIN